MTVVAVDVAPRPDGRHRHPPPHPADLQHHLDAGGSISTSDVVARDDVASESSRARRSVDLDRRRRRSARRRRGHRTRRGPSLDADRAAGVAELERLRPARRVLRQPLGIPPSTGAPACPVPALQPERRQRAASGERRRRRSASAPGRASSMKSVCVSPAAKCRVSQDVDEEVAVRGDAAHVEALERRGAQAAAASARVGAWAITLASIGSKCGRHRRLRRDAARPTRDRRRIASAAGEGGERAGGGQEARRPGPRRRAAPRWRGR